MFARSTSRPTLSELPPLSVLGLRGRGRADWSRMRALQYVRLAQVARTHAIIQGIAGLAVVWLFRPLANPGQLAVWLLALAVSLHFGARAGLAFRHVGRRMPARRLILAHLLATALNAARIEMWTILALLMAASAIVIPAVPLATTIFAVVAGATTVAAFCWRHDFVMADVAGLFSLVTIGGAIEASRRILSSATYQ